MPIDRTALKARIENAADYIAPLWPLQGFNATNPLLGFEELGFDRAVQQANQLFRGRGYPDAAMFRQAWENGEIDPDILTRRLAEHGVSRPPEQILQRMEMDEGEIRPRSGDDGRLNREMIKWLSAFVDQGQAVWPMPNREDGFYAAWRTLAGHGGAMPEIDDPSDLPPATGDALEAVLEAYPESQWERIFLHHFRALPGWTSFIKWRARRGETRWQEKYPIRLADYLAVRLTLASRTRLPIAPNWIEELPPNGEDRELLPRIWLKAWEESYRRDLLGRLREGVQTDPDRSRSERPDAQLVFCIDVRSEVLRRHLEEQGDYETYGYAGFFGVPTVHEPYGADGPVKSCPPILDPRHHVKDRVDPDRRAEAQEYDGWDALRRLGSKILKELKEDVAAAFGFVEGGGAFFGGAMTARTLVPSWIFRMTEAIDDRIPRPEAFTRPSIDRNGATGTSGARNLPVGLSQQAKVLYAAAAFQLMGWDDQFAPVVVFAGHASQTPNNPYKSSLDCGACAGNPGGPNARILAAICNESSVREALREEGIDIPEDTVFLAAEHNTTTDEVELYAEVSRPGVSEDQLDGLRADLEAARRATSRERVRSMNASADPGSSDSGVRETIRRAGDWAETRPEWGLARNASFIIGPREITEGIDLDGRSFLHSYDWRTDTDGTALENIMTGPLVVGQWINAQYYFSTVDNAAFGSGSKVTQNVVGKVGIYQGNGSDLMSGLPLQSLNRSDDRIFHRPLRLTAVVHAPRKRVHAVVRRHTTLLRFFHNEWVHLIAIDPTEQDSFLRYRSDGTWQPYAPVSGRTEARTTAANS